MLNDRLKKSGRQSVSCNHFSHSLAFQEEGGLEVKGTWAIDR